MAGPGLDAASLMGAPTNKTGGDSHSQSPQAPQEAVQGAMRQLNKINGSLGEHRETLSGLAQQFPMGGKTGQQALQLIDMLQKVVASYMKEITTSTSREMGPGQNLSALG
jgi:hypothetical protein